MLSERTATSTLVLRAEFNLTGKDEAKYYRGNEYYFIFHSLLMKKKTFSHLDLVQKCCSNLISGSLYADVKKSEQLSEKIM